MHLSQGINTREAACDVRSGAVHFLRPYSECAKDLLILVNDLFCIWSIKGVLRGVARDPVCLKGQIYMGCCVYLKGRHILSDARIPQPMMIYMYSLA